MSINNKEIFNDYLEQWHLTEDGEPIITHSSRLLPVRYQGSKAMLKIALSEEERLGALLMIWWNGGGAARVLEHASNAILMERAVDYVSLSQMSHQGYDDEASSIICSVAAKLHAHKNNPPRLLPLNIWFKRLEIAAVHYVGIFKQAADVAKELLDSPQEIVVLHGDLHHGNILDFGQHGWLAIDPKHVMGERGFEFANIFCNPDKEVALQPGRFLRQVSIVADFAQLERTRLLKWILAYSGLSAAWSLEDGESPEIALAVAELAKLELQR